MPSHRIGLGTYKTFDVGDNLERRTELARVLKAFVESGGSLIDSSPMYGTSERVVGDLARANGLQDKLFMATKVWTSGREHGIQQMNESLKLLGRKQIELMQIHNLVDWKVHLKTLRQWKEEGKVKFIGITHYTSSSFAEMKTIVESEPLDFIQIPYSIAEVEALEKLIPAAANKNVAVIANEPFAHGRLFHTVKQKKLPEWSKEMGVNSWAQYFLKFILATDSIRYAIPGTGKLTHLMDNMAAVNGRFPTEKEREKMRREFLAI